MFRFLFVVFSLVISISTFANETFKLDAPVSGKLPRSISLSVSKISNEVSYSFLNNYLISKGKTLFHAPINVLLIDLNFDGYADLWLNGCTSGQCRGTKSDVWLYELRSKKYKLNQVLGALPDLNVDIEKQIIVSGVTNTGCAGMNFYLETYRWQNDKLTKLYRREQQCSTDNSVHYFEYKLKKGMMTKVSDEPVSDPESTTRRKLDLDLLNVFNYEIEI